MFTKRGGPLIGIVAVSKRVLVTLALT